jgi:hypothetical protein
MPKPSVKYSTLHRCAVGARALVTPVNHPVLRSTGVAVTSLVLKYDPVTGHFETHHTCYVPAPFADWPGGGDCLVGRQPAVPLNP